MAKTYSPTALIVAALVAVSAVYLTMPGTAPPPRTAPQSISELSSDRYLKDVTYLASDELKGRGDGSPELDRAADYIAEQFRLAGLSPGGEANSYFQGFDITTGAVLGAKNEFSVAGAKLRINDDFVPINFSSTAEFEGPLVFAGYGITAPEYKYDDYSGIDASGKIVVVFEREPQENDPKSVFAGTALTPHASFTNKAINARLHGAKGIIFIAPPSQETEDLGLAERQEAESDLGISAVHTKRSILAKAFKDSGKDPAALEQAIDKDLTPQSFALTGAQARIATDVVRTRKIIRNVIGVLPGADPNLKNEWVVVGAHYDHLGLGNRNSLAPSQIGQVHHGADDNASGTAGVMELARIAAKNNHAWKRSVLFIAFAGEEIGLLGSSNFANHPTVPIKSIDAMINMDMIGRVSNDRLFIGGIGTSPSLKQTVEDFNKPVGLALNFSDSGYGSSDHTSFNAKKIPVLFFFSGLHTDYHKPSDTADKINAQGAVKVLSVVYGTVDRLATDAQRLPYHEVAQPPQVARGSGGGYGPYFGSVPDFRDDLKGVLFSDVQNNSPAAKAGLKGGDLLVEFDGKQILTLSDYAYALRTKKPGDIVAVVVKRNGQDVKADVTLEARR
jgi:Zn-dependent M28 family amino/carboxypeptidase